MDTHVHESSTACAGSGAEATAISASGSLARATAPRPLDLPPRHFHDAAELDDRPTNLMRSRLLFLSATLSLPLLAADDYALGPDSQVQPGVPHGTLTKASWTSKIFPGTVRDYWVYVPAQYAAAKPACVMVFQDGAGYASTNGSWRVPVVFDNLIHRKEMPVTIGVFINPGVVPAPSTNALARYNRSFEYDGLGDQYARFLLEEILPEVAKDYNLSTNGNDRAIGGASSGAICAFTAAWERPDQFSRVFSTIGTYVGLRGGNDYPTLIRKTEPKPVRVFLQDGSGDLNIYGGNWWLSPEDIRQLRGEVREWTGEAQQLRRDLTAENIDPRELDEILRALRQLDDPRVYQDVSELQRLQSVVAEGLKRFEFGLRRQADVNQNAIVLSGSDEVPEEFRKLVQEYYRSLARTPR